MTVDPGGAVHRGADEDAPTATATPRVQLGFGEQKPQRAAKAYRNHCPRRGRASSGAARVPPARTTRPTRSARSSRSSGVFKAGDLVDVTGITKGRGFTGVIKRHGFSGFPGSHGTHEYFRHGGSIGNRSYPGPRLQGQAHGRPVRQRARDHAESRGRRGASGRPRLISCAVPSRARAAVRRDRSALR